MNRADRCCWRRSGGKDIGRKGKVDRKGDADDGQQDGACPRQRLGRNHESEGSRESETSQAGCEKRRSIDPSQGTDGVVADVVAEDVILRVDDVRANRSGQEVNRRQDRNRGGLLAQVDEVIRRIIRPIFRLRAVLPSIAERPARPQFVGRGAGSSFNAIGHLLGRQSRNVLKAQMTRFPESEIRSPRDAGDATRLPPHRIVRTGRHRRPPIEGPASRESASIPPARNPL